MNLQRLIGWAITIVGFGFLFIKAFGDFTGFAISDSVYNYPSFSYLIGLGIMWVGLAVIVFSEKKTEINNK